jgi:hypothetical protein
MFNDTYDTGCPTLATSLTITGSAAAGFIELPTQSSNPGAGSASSNRIYTDSAGNLNWKSGAGYNVTFNTASATGDQTITFPDVAGNIITDTSTATLQNKTILAAAGNVVEATRIGGLSITGTPSNGDYLRNDAGTWVYDPITADSPLSFLSGNMSISTGQTTGTVALGDDPRFSTQQLLPVKKGTIGAGEYSTIADALTAIAGFGDAAPTKPYVIDVDPGIFVEDSFTLPPNVYIRGTGIAPTVLTPSTPNVTFITMNNRCGLNNLVVNGLGGTTDIGVWVDSGIKTILLTVIVQNFSTCVKVTATTAITDLLFHEFAINGAFDTAVHVDGRAITGLFACNVSITLCRIIGDASSTYGLKFEGPNAFTSCNSVRSLNISTGAGMWFSDGADIELANSKVDGCDIGMHLPNIGAGCDLKLRGVLFIDSVTNDVLIENPGTIGVFDGMADRTKVSVDASAEIAMTYRDFVNPGTVVSGDLFYIPNNGAVVTETGQLQIQEAAVGVYTGGIVTKAGGFDVDVSAGAGYIVDGVAPAEYMRKITWAGATLTLSANTINYIYVDKNGIQVGGAIPSVTTANLLARVRANSVDIEFIDVQRQSCVHPHTNFITMLRNAFQTLYSTGSVVTFTGLMEINVSPGQYYYLGIEFNPVGGAIITFATYYHVAGVWSHTHGVTVVSNSQYDDGTNLTAIPMMQYARHLLYVCGDGVDEQYFLVYAQATYLTFNDAEFDTVTTGPAYFGEGVGLIAGIIVQQGSSTLTYVDLRPKLGAGSSGVVAVVTDHGNLAGLTDDDHQQYLLTSGTRAMGGDLNMGGNAITSAGLINGVTIAAHASRHLPNGADPLATAAPLISLSGSSTNSVGTANSFARSDHSHAIDVASLDLNNFGGTLGVLKGGTGVTTLTSGRFVVGAGAAIDLTKVVPGGVVVGTTDAQTLTNKDLVDSSTTFVDVTDATKKIIIDAAGTTGTSTTLLGSQTASRVLTLPDATDTLVGKATVDILTNKVLTGGSGGNTVAANLIQAVNISAVAPAATNVLKAIGATSAAWGVVDIAETTGTVTVARGGTGLTTITTGAVMIGAGTGSVNISRQAPVGAFVGTTDTQTLSNKTLLDSTTLIGATADVTKAVGWSVSGATTGTTTTLTFAQTASRVITMPNATDTLVGKATTDVLTNKTITGATNIVSANSLKTTGADVGVASAAPPSAGQVLTASSAVAATWVTPAVVFADSTFRIQDVVDATKQISFDAAGTTGTTMSIVSAPTINRVLTLPDATDTLVGKATTDTLTNKTLTAPTIATITNGGILTLPTGSRTIVARDTTDTLTNKTLLDSTTIIGAAADATKAVGWSIGGATTGTTTTLTFAQTASRALTLPDATDTLVGRATTDTLTNKTLAAASCNFVSAVPSTIAFNPAGTAGTKTTLTSTQTVDRTLTLPNLTDTIVTKTSTDTLTNKSITGGTGGNTVAADLIRAVTVSATAPVTNYGLVATSATTAAWTNLVTLLGKSLSCYVTAATDGATNGVTWGNVTSDTITGTATGCIHFAGSASIGITEVSIIATMDIGVTGDIRLYDVTNALVLCTFTGLTANTATISTTTTIANIPAGPSILQFQAQRTVGGGSTRVYLNGYSIKMQ